MYIVYIYIVYIYIYTLYIVYIYIFYIYSRPALYIVWRRSDVTLTSHGEMLDVGVTSYRLASKINGYGYKNVQ